MIHMDYETYSEAGYYTDATGKPRPLRKGKSGIEIVGSAVYAEHPSMHILSLAYKIGNNPTQLWIEGMPEPQDLWDAIARGEKVAAWNSPFEYGISRGMIPLEQFVDPSVLARVYGLPGSLEKAGAVLKLTHEKLKEGKQLINKFSVPQKGGRNDPRLDPVDGPKFYEYNIRDVDAEVEAMSKLPPLIPFEQKVWELDQRINDRGVYIDVPALKRLIEIYETETVKYVKELQDITCGAVNTGSEVAKMLDWLKLGLANLDAENVERALALPGITAAQRRVLELRQILSLSSCKKLYSISDRLCSDNRIRWILQYYGADRTGRWAGRGPQPQNLPGGDPELADAFLSGGPPGPDVLGSVSGALRGLFIPPPGYDFLCSDYSAIEAVVLACLAGEQWRIDVFKTHGKIYEMSASKITGIPFEEFLRVKRETGEHHPMRKKVGKVAELASGYQGGYGAWMQFGADKYLSEPEIRDGIKAWRAASPAIVQFWYKIEDCAKLAVQYPGNCFEYRGIKFQVQNDILHLRLLSGRILYYHNPRLHQELTPWGKEVSKLTFMGNSQFGWERIDTYGGKLTENIVQATARDILANALLNLDAAGYMTVLHVHDEICCEIPEGWGTIEEMEKLMGALPEWCKDWPIRAAGGWRGKRYKKEL